MVKKVLTIISLVSISLMAGILIVSAVEKSGEKQGEYVSVADNTDDSSIHKGAEKPKVDIKIEKKIDQKKDVVTVTYSEAELKVDENGYAWLKIQLAPLQDGEYYYSDDYYYSIGDNVGTLSDSPYDYYFGLNEDMLEEAAKQGKDVVVDDVIQWLGKENDTKNMRLTDLKIIVKTSNITLYDKDDETELWNEETYKKIVSESQVSEVTETETEKSKDKTPKTGNTSTIIVIALGILSIISSAGAILIKE